MTEIVKIIKKRALKIILNKIKYQTIKINNFIVKTCGFFAYDGSHKIYILENAKNIEEAINCNYNILKIEKIEEVYYNITCKLKFICNWDLTKTYASQFTKE